MTRRTHLALLLTLAFLGSPLVAGHGPAGTPDTSCEDTDAEWSDHDYGPPAAGLLLAGFQESNLRDCDADFDPTQPACAVETVLAQDFDGDGVACEAIDDDGHSEYANGGAWLLVDSGDAATHGSLACFGEPGHHPRFGPFLVEDTVYGSGVGFTVASDVSSATPPDPVTGVDCGDFEAEETAACYGKCAVSFGPGVDGSYQVYVGATLEGAPATIGHVSTGAMGIDLNIPGPLVLNVYWNGTGTTVEWVYQGSFECEPVADDHFMHFRFECDPLDVVNFHCVNPGIVVDHMGPDYSVTHAELECGSVYDSCTAYGPVGTCQRWLGGDNSAQLICTGGYDIIVGGGNSYPPTYHVTCYSDPPQLPPPPVPLETPDLA